nr:aspartate kinase [Candidatus Sigynarchaeota archaeon]
MDKEIVIMKVGGSCLTSAKSLAQLLRIIDLFKDQTIVFVASAFSGVTDKLIDIAKAAKEKNEAYKAKLKDLRKEHDEINAKLFEGKTMHLENAGDFITQSFRSLEEILEQIFDYGLEPFRQDYVESFGEKLSTFVMAEYLVSEGMDGVYMPADLLIVTDDRFGNALPIMDFTARKVSRQVVPVLNRGGIPCITGFIGLNKQGFVTTLGRGGTDYTASIIANCLVQAYPGRKVRVIFWKNVDGILSSSPDFVKKPRLIEHLKYTEAKEISHFGAKVLHPKCITPMEIGIPIEIRNFEKSLDTKFTRIDEKGDDSILLKGFSILKDVALVTAKSGSLVAVPGVLAKIFTILGESGISVSLVSQSSSEINTT